MKDKVKTCVGWAMPEVKIGLTKSRKQYAKATGCPPQSDSVGETSTAEGYTAVVWVDKSLKKNYKTYALLAHEALHCAIRYFEQIGEANPGEEVMAYAVQLISGMLFDMFENYKK